MKHLLWSVLLWTGCVKKPTWEINNGVSTDNNTAYYTIVQITIQSSAQSPILCFGEQLQLVNG